MFFNSFLAFLLLVVLASAVKVCREDEWALIFRLGRLILPRKGPGIFLTIPIIDKMLTINLRSEKDLDEAERVLWEAKTQRGVDHMEIERHLSELAEIRSNLSKGQAGSQMR